jgi:GTP-binding protein
MSKARFAYAGVDEDNLPVSGLPEVAIAGRSNVGKSSFLNVILGSPGLVRTSRTPGRTQALNVFIWEEQLALVDMPGYGYAKLPKLQRQQISNMLSNYISKRKVLSGVVMLLDARREEISEDDRKMAGLIQAAQLPLLLVATKMDLVPRNKLQQTIHQIEQSIGVAADSAIPFSSVTKTGRDQVIRELLQCTRD